MPFAKSVLTACDENVIAIAAVIRQRRLEDPGQDWLALVLAEAAVWHPFMQRHLDIDAWLLMLIEACE